MLQERKTINIFIRMLHIGAQIALAYWAVKIDGQGSCSGDNIDLTSYLSYVLIVLNLLFVFMLKRGANIPKNMAYVVLAIDAALVIGVLYFSIQGYNTYNNCASNKVLFQFNFIVTVTAVVSCLFVLFLNLNWAQRYINWPGNIAWPIIFLAFSSEGQSTSALIIGVSTLVVCVSSFIVNALVYNSLDFSSSKKKAMNTQWAIAMALHFICQVIAVYNLVKPSGSSGFGGDFAKKTIVVFALVNIIDMAFWAWAKSKMSIWSSLPDF